MNVEKAELMPAAGNGAPATGHPRISLVIPMFQAAGFIGSALASVAGQTRPFDEVVVVDDASQDDGVDRARCWADRLPLRVLRQPRNCGPGVARRAGIDATSGELIALLDADDVLLPDHVTTMLATYERHGGLVTADALWWAPSRQLSLVPGRDRRRVPPVQHQRLGILEHNFVQPTTLFSRADYERAGGFSTLRHMEDWDLWMRMIRQGVPVTMAPTPTVLYRIHEDSLSAGRGDLGTTLAALPGWLGDVTPEERKVLRRTIRRRRARVDLLAGEQRAADGDLLAACLLWTRAAVRDRRLSGALTGGRSSVTLQALGNLASCGRVGKVRAARAGSAGTGLRSR